MRHRSSDTEWMDTEAVTPEDYAACLADLATVNTVTLARLPTLAFMRRAVRRAGGRPLSVLDVACGEGDMLRRLHRWSRHTGHKLALTGLDLSAPGIDAARAATPPDMPITYLRADAFDPALENFDIIISSLFTHHLGNDQVVAFLRMMEAKSTVGWFVNDLQRHPIAYYGFSALSSLAGWHRFVQHDGPVSVARSFHRVEWRRLVAAAGLNRPPVQVRWHMPFRICVSRLK